MLEADSDSSLLTFYNAAQVAHVGRTSATSLNGENDLFSCFGVGIVMKVQPAINALVGPILLLNRASIYESQGPPLELIRVVGSQCRCIAKMRDNLRIMESAL